MKNAVRWVLRRFPLLVIGLAYAWALGVVGLRVFHNETADKQVICIAHWQLEPGFRQGLSDAAAEYQKLHPGIEIRQEAIPESGYGQWLSIQLLGGTAPDIVEMGSVTYNQLIMFYQRYIVPLTPFVAQPNPYNRGTDLETTPLLNTYMDGMRQSFIPELQEYMTIPLARTSVRLIYNKTLLKKLTGLDEAPADFRSFLAACEKIQSATQPDGRRYTPISCSQYHLQGWTQSLFLPATYGAYRDFDFNCDGRVGGDEWAVGYMTGKINFDNPSYRGSFALMKEFTRFFQPGWIGLTRDEAIFKFAQQKAVFISSGLWEVNGLEQLADGKFEIGIMDFPLPRADDPEFGHLIEGPRYENPAGIPGGNAPFAITKTSPHQDIALDFLLFLASRQQDEKFTERLGWLPIIEGARSSPKLKVFEPTLQGVFPAFYPTLGGESVVKWQQLQPLFLVGQMDYSQLSAAYAAFYRDKGREDFDEYLRNMLRGQTQQARVAADMRVTALTGDSDGDSDAWRRYRAVALRPLDAEVNTFYYRDLISNPDRTRKMPLYQYTPEAWDHLRATNAASTVPTKN